MLVTFAVETYVISGTTGVFYKEFGLTMAAAVALSLLNTLTLCPALCALILRPKKQSAKAKPIEKRSILTATIVR